MRLLKRKSNRLMILALVSAAFIPNLMSIVGCSGAAARVDIPKSVDELPPVDHMALEKSRKADIVIERGDTIELTYMAAIDTYKTLGPVTFLGVEPETRMLGLLSESGEKLAILSDAIQNIARIMDSGLSLVYEIGADQWQIKMPKLAPAPAAPAPPAQPETVADAGAGE
jgi:hypothetical protein